MISNLAVSYTWLERYDDALREYRRSLELGEKTMGADHPFVARAPARAWP